MSRMPRGLGLAVGLLTLLVACNTPDQPRTARDAPVEEPTVRNSEGGPLQWSGTLARTGPGLDSEQAIEQVLATLGTDEVTDIEADAVPAPGNSTLPGLVIHVSGDGGGPAAQARLRWLAAVAGGAVADLMRTDEQVTNEIIDRLSVVERLPSGGTEELGGGLGAIAAGQVFEAQDTEADDDTITDRVVGTLHDFGLSATSVEVFHPLGPAVSVVAVLPDDARVDWTLDDLREAVMGDPRAYEGLCIEIDSSTGFPLIVGSVAYRTGEGGLWFADGQDEVFEAVHGGLPVHP